jgi:hypothetical protein
MVLIIESKKPTKGGEYKPPLTSRKVGTGSPKEGNNNPENLRHVQNSVV